MSDSKPPKKEKPKPAPKLPDTSISDDNQFVALGLSAKVVRPLAVLGISVPTPIQKEGIPLVLAGHDVMGLAQTGTGKTAAFGLPLVHKLLESDERPEPKSARCLILAPTRELVNQIADNLRGYVKKTPVWVSSVVGGQSIKSQIRHLEKGTDILVATPGRLLDLVDRKALFLNTVQYLVLDEADQMLDLGFIHSLRKIAKLLGTPRQTLLFSATMPKAVEELSRAYLNDPVRVEVSPPGKAADKVKQCVYMVQTKGKTDLLKDLLGEREDDLSLVFARTKHGAEKLMKHLVTEGFSAVSIHGNKSQGQRDRALREFKSGKARILVATDVAARGIDIRGVTHVYNYNLPEVPENYVHRIGRTARAGREGEAIAFCAPEERKLLRQIERLMSIKISVEGSDGSESLAEPETENKRRRGRGGGNTRGDGSPKKKSKPHRGGDGKPAHKKHPKRDKDRLDEGEREQKYSDAPRREDDNRSRPKRKPRHAKGGDNGPPRDGKFGGGKSDEGKSSSRPRGGKPGGKSGGRYSEKPSGKFDGNSDRKPSGKPTGKYSEKPRGKFDGKSDRKPSGKTGGYAGGKPGEKSSGKAGGRRFGGGKPGGGKPGGGKPGGHKPSGGRGGGGGKSRGGPRD